MLREIMKDLLVWIGAMTVMVAVAGIVFNEILWGHWSGASQERQPRKHEHTRDR